MVGRRARGQGTPQEHIDTLLQVNLDEIMKAIVADNGGFLNLVPPLDDKMFSTAEKDTRARELYDTKIRKIMRDGYERNINLPTAGFTAGPCLLKDTMQLSSFYKQRFSLGHAAMNVNESMPNFILKKT